MAGWEITSSLNQARVPLVAFDGMPSGTLAQDGGEVGVSPCPMQLVRLEELLFHMLAETRLSWQPD